MIEKFPEINEPQVVLARANTQYGHVLDESFTLSISDTQKVYTVFENVDKAKDYANSFLNKTMDYEFVIYNHKQELLHHLNPYDIKKN